MPSENQNEEGHQDDLGKAMISQTALGIYYVLQHDPWETGSFIKSV